MRLLDKFLFDQLVWDGEISNSRGFDSRPGARRTASDPEILILSSGALPVYSVIVLLNGCHLSITQAKIDPSYHVCITPGTEALPDKA